MFILGMVMGCGLFLLGDVYGYWRGAKLQAGSDHVSFEEGITRGERGLLFYLDKLMHKQISFEALQVEGLCKEELEMLRRVAEKLSQ